MTMASEVIPYEQTAIAAVDDRDAIEKAAQWVATVREMVDDETWLVVKQDARSVHMGRP